ncbi:MAG TPA: PD-(D/E)XK nuclease family protein, partial [Bacteroidales bacterium]|nr:PD-(D/E)XK nuclease family protein [Bacteroidales bacterium]
SQFEIIGTEVELTHKLSIDKQEFNLHGFCDRIDNRTGTPTLLDYKTGKVDTKELIFKDMNILFTNIAQKQLFQLMVYAYLYRNDHNMKDQLQSEPLCCGIVSFQEMLKNPDNNLIIPTIPSDNSLIYDDLINEFEENLKELLKEIVNHPEINHQKNDEKITDYQLRKEYFLQTDQTDHCKYCDYQLLCGRIVTNNW